MKILEDALTHLKRGELVIHPTEAVYGIGGFLDDAPLARLRRIKDRPGGGFVVLIPSTGFVRDLLGATGRLFAQAFWPGPLTLVLDDPEDRFHPAAKAADGSVAVRVPGHPVTLKLLETAGQPITSTSANPPGGAPARTVAAARDAGRAMGAELFALEGGPLPGGAPSTLVRPATRGAEVIRQGSVDPARLGEVVRLARSSRSADPPRRIHMTFVCTGNTCRSPMAEVIARRLIDQRRLSQVTVESAGTAALPDGPASEGARTVVQEAGLDLDGHESAVLTRELVARSDIVLCMDTHHLVRARELGGSDECRLLSEMAGEGGAVQDPFGGSDDRYRATFAELEHLVEAAVSELVPGAEGAE
ncbi:MAG: Sua5/YciO/YrdC/YwlC family protein [Gemmatimonadota bacterium]|nr:Sua5/YciO/YrdC/YwlC family protein [Gemmatimonadota bacterium]